MALNTIELIRRAQAGDLEAFENLVFQHDRQVLTIAARFVQNADDAKDIYQEVFIRVFRSLRKFRLESDFATWVYRITTNVCLSHQSRRRRRHHESLDAAPEEGDGDPAEGISTDASPYQQTVDRETARRIDAALNVLSPKQRMVFTLKHYQEQTLTEIAKSLNCSEGTVKKDLFLALRRLRLELKDLY